MCLRSLPQHADTNLSAAGNGKASTTYAGYTDFKIFKNHIVSGYQTRSLVRIATSIVAFYGGAFKLISVISKTRILPFITWIGTFNRFKILSFLVVMSERIFRPALRAMPTVLAICRQELYGRVRIFYNVESDLT